MKIKLLISALLLSWGLNATSQVSRPIPVLQGNPDARTAAMGGVMGANTGGMYLYTTPGAALFRDGKLHFDFSTEVFPRSQDTNGRTMQYNLAGAYRFHDRHAGFLGFRYQGGTEYSYFDIERPGDKTVVKPFNWTLDAGYAFKVSDRFSLDASAGLVASWIGKGAYAAGFSVGGYYRDEVMLGRTPTVVGLGVRVADIGAPLTYKEAGMSYALPTSLLMAGGLDMQVAPLHRLNLLAGARYFLAPRDAALLTMGLGAEYGYHDFLFARAGFQYGQREQSFTTVGVGAKYMGITLDATYRISTAKDFGVNTLMVGLGYSF